MSHAGDDPTLQRFTSFVRGLRFEDLPPSAIDAAKVRVIDTLGALMAGLEGAPSLIARKLALETSDRGKATLIGTRFTASTETAAFVNAVTGRYAEANDVYDKSGSRNGHPSDVISPLIAVAESIRASGRELIVATIAAYEIYLFLCDRCRNLGFDHTTFGGIATAAGAARLLGLGDAQLADAISTAAVTNNILRQVRAESSMWKVTAAGQSGRAGVSAALLAQAGMKAPSRPFAGVAGWCGHVALSDLSRRRWGRRIGASE